MSGNASTVSLPSIGSNPISNAYESTREISDDNREYKTQNYSGWRFQDYLSAARWVYLIETIWITEAPFSLDLRSA